MANCRMACRAELPFGQISIRSFSDGSGEDLSDRFVFVGLLSRDGRSVLVTDGGGVDTGTAAKTWRLPLFMYNSGWHEDTARLVRDLTSALGMARNVECCEVGKPFSVGPDLLGLHAIVTAGVFGFISLQVLYLHEELDCELSSNFKWADADLLVQLRETIMEQRESIEDKMEADVLGVVYDVLGYVHELVGPNGATKLQSFVDRRFHREWSIKAASWFRQSLEKLNEIEFRGPMLMHISSVTSTIMKMETSQGWYFLKAPCHNSTEIEATVAVANLVPQLAVRVEAVNNELGCFITKGLAKPDELKHISRLQAMMDVLAKVQLASVGRVKELLNSGVPDRRPLKFAEIFATWLDDSQFRRLMYTMRPQHIPKVFELCKRLENSKIPCTLVHGDFSVRNVGVRMESAEDHNKKTSVEFRDEDLVLFDWQMACISHPFSDVQELYCDYDGFSEPLPSELHDVDVDRQRALFDARQRYLSYFCAEFGVSESELKEEFALGRCYGNCVMFWSMMEALPGTEYQIRPRLAESLRHIFSRLMRSLKDLNAQSQK